MALALPMLAVISRIGRVVSDVVRPGGAAPIPA